MSSDKKIISTFEVVDFPDFDMPGVIAKVDTGAFTGALHCTQIVETVDKGVTMLHFSPFDHPEITIKTSDYAIRKVKSSNGRQQSRFFIRTNIKIQDEVYPIELSLADRSEMKWSVLVGRRFLRKYKFLVDVNRAGDIVT